MTYFTDMHTHSTASDGQHSPAELVGLAKEKGLELLALTDHDTLDGLYEAMAAGEREGLMVLPGVELGAQEYRNLHLLGYGFRVDDPGLRGFCTEMKEARDRRKYKIVEFLKEKGVDIDLGEVEAAAKGGVVARPHFAKVMLEHGYIKTNREAYDKYLDTKEYQRIAIERRSARECIETIHRAGGKVSFAHPYQLKLDDEALEELVKELKSYGLDAIECYYTKHTPEMQAQYLALAEKYGLHVTGGSDFHGAQVKPDVPLGKLRLELGWLLDGQ